MALANCERGGVQRAPQGIEGRSPGNTRYQCLIPDADADDGQCQWPASGQCRVPAGGTSSLVLVLVLGADV
jgi:hypothetical protein